MNKFDRFVAKIIKIMLYLNFIFTHIQARKQDFNQNTKK